MRLLHTLAATTVLAAASLTQAVAADITGAGATFPFPIYGKWADAYKKETNVGLNYQSIGSGGGIKQIQAKTGTTPPITVGNWARPSLLSSRP